MATPVVASTERPDVRRLRVADAHFATFDPMEPELMNQLRWAYWYLKPAALRGEASVTDEDLSYLTSGHRDESAVFSLDDRRRVRCRLRDCLWRAAWDGPIGNENGCFGRVVKHLKSDHGETHEAYQIRHRRARIALMKEIAMSFVCTTIRLEYHPQEVVFAVPQRFKNVKAHRLGGCGAIAKATDAEQEELWRFRLLRGEPDLTEDDLLIARRFNESEFAIKKLDISRDAPDPLKRTCREVTLAMTLNHPNVVAAVDMYFDISQTQLAATIEKAFDSRSAEPFDSLVRNFSAVYLVMPFHPKSLQDHLSGLDFRDPDNVVVKDDGWLLKPAPRGPRKRYLYDILCGVAYLHRRNVAHRDLNPKNILVVDSYYDSRLAVCDYSSAKTPDEHATEVHHCTEYYNAPETCALREIGRPLMPPPEGGADVHREDMWAIGCIAAEMILGRPLFAAPPGHGRATALARIFDRCGCGTLDPEEIREVMRNLGVARRVYTESLDPQHEQNPRDRATQLRRTVQQFTEVWNEVVDKRNTDGRPMQVNSLASYLEPLISNLVQNGVAPPTPEELDLISKLLSVDPRRRPTCEEAYQHPFFKNDPSYHTDDPTTHSLLPPRDDVRDAIVTLNIPPNLNANDARQYLWQGYLQRHPQMVELIECCRGRHGFRTVLLPPGA